MLVELLCSLFSNDTLDVDKSSAGVLGVFVDRTAAHRVDPLSDATTDVERVIAQTQGVLMDAREAFCFIARDSILGC